MEFEDEKLFKETGPTNDNGLVDSSKKGGISTGDPGPSPAEDAKARGMPSLESGASEEE